MANRTYPDRPRVGVGALVIHEDKVLLVRRGVAPNEGQWAVPGGSLELGETLQTGAERETLEETGVTVRAKKPVYAFDYIERDDSGMVRFHFVIVDLSTEYISGEPVGHDDALEARWVGKVEITALPVGENTLKLLRYVGFID
ncbi:MAG: NUDIX hydrolase [Syntrophaceae bacterium]|nr:NUDIX hydrolase [Syntrophaceae bacterium]